MKKILLRLRDFFCTKIPFISLAGIGLCWLVYLEASSLKHSSLDDTDPPFWFTMGIITQFCFFFGALFVLSLLSYLIYRPLPAQRKWLHILLRLLIAAVAAVVTAGGVWLSVFVFAGTGG